MEKDRPIAGKIILEFSLESSILEDFITLSNILYSQNLIYSEPREFRRVKNRIELRVVFRDILSFKQWDKNISVVKYWYEKFDKRLIKPPKTRIEEDIFVDVDNISNCSCVKSDFYILQGRRFGYSDELICGNCLSQISYSRIPLNIRIEGWQREYGRVYLSWLDSGILEKWALRELMNYKKGKLNIEGERIRKQLSEFFDIPVYISYFVEEYPDKGLCSLCGSEGVESGLRSPSKICLDCNTIFSYKLNE